MILGCGINDAVDRASERCEDEIEKIIQSVESTCLTKDELFEIIDSVRARNDQKKDCVGKDQTEREE
jgi:hypothetical protein